MGLPSGVGRHPRWQKSLQVSGGKQRGTAGHGGAVPRIFPLHRQGACPEPRLPPRISRQLDGNVPMAGAACAPPLSAGVPDSHHPLD